MKLCFWKATIEPKIDPSDLLFLGASDMTGAVLIPIKMVDLENYGIWRGSINIGLLGKGKYDFVMGTCSKDTYREELHE